MGNYSKLACEKNKNIAIVTFHNPPVNVLTKDALLEIKACFEELGKDKSLRAVIFTGMGKSFIAGADVNSFGDTNGAEISRFGQEVFSAVESCPLAVIGAINGYALGGGMELALCCDFRMASSSAVMGFPETGLGILPAYGGLSRLPLLIGEAEAKKLIFTADRISAQEAERVGLVQQIFEPDQLLDGAVAFAERISRNAPIAIALAKESILKARQTDFTRQLQRENEASSFLGGTEDFKEGMNAFTEKRTPIFRNC